MFPDAFSYAYYWNVSMIRWAFDCSFYFPFSIFQFPVYLKSQDEAIHSAKKSRDGAVKQKEKALKEVEVLRVDLQQIIEDRECQVAQLQTITSKFKYKETIGHTAALLSDLCNCASSQRLWRRHVQLKERKYVYLNVN